MDFESLKNQVSNLTLYDLKAGVRKVQNAVMNYTEMETKVREATNNDPWGASASLMQEIANGTHSYQLLNEIMPLIYKRFTDKTAEEWRQIYKSLQLLEYLVKNGSERVIDDARSHLSLLRMLRQFHYIDPNGKDQGVNVRNRAQELAKLLGDVEAIRSERKKARANKNKFGGVEGGASLGGFSSGSNNRYGGFGSDDAGFGGYQGEVYGDGGGFGGRETNFSDTQRRGEAFEEYDEEEEGTAPAKTTVPRSSATRTTASAAKRESLKQKQKQKEPEQDLFDFGDEPIATRAASKAPESSTAEGEDDFDDFQSATSPAVITQPSSSIFSNLSPPPPTTSTTTSLTQFAAPKPLAPAQTANLNALFSTIAPVSATSTFSSPPPQPQAQPQPPQPSRGYVPTGPNYYTSVQSSINTPPAPSPGNAFSSMTSTSKSSFPSSASTLGKPKPAAALASAGGGDVFGSLWSTASASAGLPNRASTPNKGPDLASMAKAKSSAGIWGAGAAPAAAAPSAGMRPGAMGRNGPSASSATPTLGNGLDDLLG